VRADLFRDRKGVHVKLKKDVHASFRKKLFEHGISMQKVFNEFARLVATDDPKAMRILQEFVRRELKGELEGIDRRRLEAETLNELDQEALYDLIEGDDEDDEVHQDVD